MTFAGDQVFIRTILVEKQIGLIRDAIRDECPTKYELGRIKRSLNILAVLNDEIEEYANKEEYDREEREREELDREEYAKEELDREGYAREAEKNT
jgi:hypothetical protein